MIRHEQSWQAICDQCGISFKRANKLSNQQALDEVLVFDWKLVADATLLLCDECNPDTLVNLRAELERTKKKSCRIEQRIAELEARKR
jgi:hypothetical protein